MPFHPVAARNLAKALAATRARCVHVSSYWAYLPVARLPVSEEHPRAGGGDWVRLRREAEDVLRDVGSAILNLPDFFGPHVHTGTLQQALAEAAQGKTMNWIGSADTRHEYVFVPDAMEAACELSRRQEAYGSHWIVPGAGPITGRRAAEIASEMLGRPVAVRGAGAVMLRLVSLFNKPLRDFMQMVPDYIRPIAYDGSKLKNLLGTLPMTPYEEAIRQTLGWLNGRSSQAG
jgi:nucleoside-diphosphate-sugar epimerase